MIAMILAAGRGDRLRPVTDSIPKALVEVHGTSLLERHLLTVRAAGIDTVVINLGWLGEKIVDRIGSGARYGLNVVYSPEGDNVLETGGGILRALPLFGDEPFIVINADIFTDMTLPVAMSLDTNIAHLVLVPKPPHLQKGDFDLSGGRVRNGCEPSLTFSGVAIYCPAFFANCTPGRFSVAPMLRAAADGDRMSGSIYKGFWADVGTADRLAELNADTARGG